MPTLVKMKPLKRTMLLQSLFKSIKKTPKTLKYLSLYPPKYGFTNTHFLNSIFSDPYPFLCSKSSNLGNTQLDNLSVSDLNPFLNPKKSDLGNTHLDNLSVSDLNPFLNPKKSDIGNTNFLNYAILNTKNTHFTNTPHELMMKAFPKPYFLTPYMFCLSNFARPTFYQSTRLFSAKKTDHNENSQPIDASSSIRKPISLWPGMYHSPVTNALWEARSNIFESASGALSELITKIPSQSRTSILYKFSSDYVLWEQYRNPWNEIRMGKLVEDLDALAGTVSYKHCCNNDGTTRPILLVTASVDKIVVKKPIRVDADLTITGAVTWVGRSSMELQLEVTQSTGETSDSSSSIALVANFTFVARDSNTGKSALVNHIQPETDQEKLLWEEAEERNKTRKQKRAQQQKKEIDANEIDRLNKLLAEGRVFCDMPALADRDSILIKDTCLQNSLICQPQQRNIHGRIFGGFLMRRAFELAFATAYTFAGSAPCFLEVDHVDFLRPVDVGDFLRLKSCVLYTELENLNQPLINVEVVAHVTRPERRSSEVSNKFYFTFTVHSEAVKNGLKVRNVVPATEEEARRVIERIDAETS